LWQILREELITVDAPSLFIVVAVTPIIVVRRIYGY
jgi:hypothetical protein